MSRIPYPDMETISDKKKKGVGYPEKDPLNVTKIALLAPDGIWAGHFAYKQACVYDTIMDASLREVLILRTAYLINSEYEIYHHISISGNLGFSDEKREAIRVGDFSNLTKEERAIAQFTTEIVETNNTTDATLAEIRSLFSDAEVMEMLILVINYVGTATMASVLDLGMDVEAVKGWSKS